MTNIDSVESRVESYLDRVRTALHGQPERQIDDIMRELRAHAIELAEGRGVEAALASLGDPVDLAKAYRAESQMVRAECSSSSLRILLGLRHASRTRAGLLGWWLIPAAILAGWILRYLIDRVAQWWLRRYRQSEGGSHLVKRAN